MDKYFTKDELKINQWINNLGYRTEMQVVYGQYCADIEICDLKTIVEIDGPQHYQKEIKKRDKYLYENFDINLIFHFSVNIKYEEFKKIFLEGIERKFGSNNEIKLECSYKR